MGMVEHVYAKCVTPGCLGKMYDQIKGFRDYEALKKRKKRKAKR